MAAKMLSSQNGWLEQSVLKQLKCIECRRIIWVPIEDADLETICSQCLREEEMDEFNPVTTVKIKRRKMMTAEMLGDQNGWLEQSMVKQLKCIECGRIIWVPIEDADLEMTCSQCLREEIREMDEFNPVRYMDCIEDTRG